MPVLKKGKLQIDYTVEGNGKPVILIHSSVSANRQWRTLIDSLKSSHKVFAINLFGYGETTKWPADSEQSLYAQSRLVLDLVEQINEQVSLVGHSFGGSVALKAALLLGANVDKLILLEPNPFYLLKQHGRCKAYLEACELRDHVKYYGALCDWQRVAQRFSDYWLGDGCWAGMPENRRAAFIESLPPNFHEWDCVLNEQVPVGEWNSIDCKTLLLSDKHTRLPIIEIVDIFTAHCHNWSQQKTSGLGHMAPLTKPEIINPIISKFLHSD